MAQSSRQDPAVVYRAHATEARAEQVAARSDAATAHHDHAAAHHETAARMLENIPKVRARAVAYRLAATAATSRGEHGVASVYSGLAADQDRAADFTAARAAHYHGLGLERSSSGREAEAAHPTDEQLVDAAAAVAASRLPPAEVVSEARATRPRVGRDADATA